MVVGCKIQLCHNPGVKHVDQPRANYRVDVLQTYQLRTTEDRCRSSKEPAQAMAGNLHSPAPGSRVLHAAPRENNNIFKTTGAMSSSASMPQLTNSMSDYSSKGYNTPFKATATANSSAYPAGQSGASSGGDGKENMRTPMVSAIPTRLKQQYVQTPNGSIEPTMQELLAQSPGIVHTRSAVQHAESSNTGMASWRKGQGFKQWEQELLRSPEVRRKADVAQLCECLACAALSRY